MGQNRQERIETYLLGVIEGRTTTRGARLLRWLLRQLSRVFGFLVQLRLWLYGHGILRHHALGCQVVSIGNLTVGGTGKTPIVEIFARALQESGRKVAILSRGYKKSKPPWPERLLDRLTLRERRKPPLVVSDGRRLLLDSATSGDEPYMLASNLPQVAVLVDKNRVKSGQYAIRKLGCDTLILDDGFQYLALKHRLDIVLVDRTNPFGNRRVLPSGLLREPVRNIRRADFIFITKSTGGDGEELRKELRSLNPNAEISECRHCPRHLRNVFTGEEKPLEWLKGKRVVAISAIAAPGSFEEELRRLGSDLIHCRRFVDHHRYSQLEIISLINESSRLGADLIVTTEKDAVRFPRVGRHDVPVFFLRVQIEMISGERDFQSCISRICFR